MRKYVEASKQRPRPNGTNTLTRVAPKFTNEDYDALVTFMKSIKTNLDIGLGSVAKRITENKELEEHHSITRAWLRLWACNRRQAILFANKLFPE